MVECGFCKERDSKMRDYLGEIEKEKVRECQKALERERIAKGMQSTKGDERRLMEMQKLQMLEKLRREEEADDVERMWHQVLVEDVRRKEQQERIDFERRQSEMQDRRRAYDEQISSANRERREALRVERDKENRRLEKIRKKMEVDHYEAMKRRRDQQLTNKLNFIEGHEMKMARLRGERARESEIDAAAIQVAFEGLKRERQRKADEIHKLQQDKLVFIEHHNRERDLAHALQVEAEDTATEWRRQGEMKADDVTRSLEADRRIRKEKAAEEYQTHIHHKIQASEQERRERKEKMERVKNTAVRELRRKMKGANEELRRQIEFRDNLNRQISENQIIMEAEQKELERKQIPFTKTPLMFKQAMETMVDTAPGRISTNPVHPFRRIMDNNESVCVVHLPVLGKRVY